MNTILAIGKTAGPTAALAGIKNTVGTLSTVNLQTWSTIKAGRYATIFKMQDRITKEESIVKLNTDLVLHCKEWDVYDVLQRTFLHPHIVRMLNHSTANQYIQLEYLAGGNLHSRVQDKPLTLWQIQDVMRQIISALQYMHSKGLVYADLKLENLLVVNNDVELERLTIKLCDFQLSMHHSETVTGVRGTLEFLAPETILDSTLSFATDAWQLGVVCYELFMGYTPFDHVLDEEVFNRIKACDLTFPNMDGICIPEDARDFIRQLLTLCPAQRLSVAESSNHPFMVKAYV